MKKVGELDVNVFKRACAKRFPVGEAEIRGVELCSMWQQKLNLSWSWHSEFRRFRDDEGNYKVSLLCNSRKIIASLYIVPANRGGISN